MAGPATAGDGPVGRWALQPLSEPAPNATGAVRILFRDECLVAAHKPSGVAVHRSTFVGAAPVMLQALRDALGQFVYTVHRLDRSTSGLILFALSRASAQVLCEQFREQRVAKTYLAVVRGWPPAEGVVDHPVPTASGKLRQEAVTAYRRLATAEVPVPCGPYASSRYALLELQPHHGRYHQLRRHMKHISHPIIGDTDSGDSRHNRLFRQRFGIHRLLLQSVRLEFDHPQHGGRVCLSCAVDEELLRLFGGAPLPGFVADRVAPVGLLQHQPSERDAS